MKKKKPIINADDFGKDRLITDAIIDCHISGAVTSTTLKVLLFANTQAGIKIGINGN